MVDILCFNFSQQQTKIRKKLETIDNNNSFINHLENKKFGNEKYRLMLLLAAIEIVFEGLELLVI